MTERDTQILELTRQGISARKICERLKLDITTRSVQRVQVKYLGPTNPDGLANSVLYQIDTNLRPYIDECMKRLGKDPYLCGICDERQKKPCDLHHTRYEGATIYDLMYVCRSCNLARANKGLS